MFSPNIMHTRYVPAPPFAQPYSPMIHQIPQQAFGMGGRGILGRLFQGLGGASKFGRFTASPIQPMNLMSIIENTQKVINIVQNVTPMVQQYGPIIRNLPQIYKMLKESPTIETPTNEVNVETAVINEVSQPPALTKDVTILTKETPMIAGNIPAPKMYV